MGQSKKPSGRQPDATSVNPKATRPHRSFLKRFKASLAIRVAIPALFATIVAVTISLSFFLRTNSTVDELAQEARLHDESMIALQDMQEATLELRYSVRQAVENGSPEAMSALDSLIGTIGSLHEKSMAKIRIADAGQPEADDAAHRELGQLFADCEVIHDGIGASIQGLVEQGVIVEDVGAVGIDKEQFLTGINAEIERMQQIDNRIETLLGAERERTVAEQQEAAMQANRIALAAGAAALLLGLGIAVMFARKMVMPVRQISLAANRMAAGDLSQKVEASGSDELSLLARSFNSMAKALEQRTQQLEREKTSIRAIHQSIGDGIIVIDNEGFIVSLNPAAETAIGGNALYLEGKSDVGVHSLQEMIDMPPLAMEDMRKCWEVKQCTHPECPSFESSDRRCWLQCATHCYNQIQGTFRQKRDACERCDVFQVNAVRQFELTIDERHFSCAIIPVLNDEGQQEGRTVVLHDITEIHGAKRELEKHSAQLERLQDLSSAVSGSLDLHGTLDDGIKKIFEGGQYDTAAIYLADSDGELVLASVEGFEGRNPEDLVRLDSHMVPAESLRSGAPILVPDLRRFRRCPDSLKSSGVLSAAIIPLKEDVSEVLGILCVGRNRLDAFDKDDLSLLKLMAAQISIAAKNAMLYEERVRYSQQMLTRNRIISTLTSSLLFEDVSDTFAAEVKKLADFDFLDIALLNPDKTGVETVVAGGCQPQAGEGELPLAGSVMEWIIDRREPLIREDLPHQRRFSRDATLAESGVRSCVNLPLIAKNNVIGMLSLYSNKQGAFSPQTAEELQPVADNLALTLVNQELFRHVAAAKAEWEATFDAVREGIIVVNEDHVIVRLNRAAAEMIGSTVEELTGESCRSRLHRMLTGADGQCILKGESLGADSIRSEVNLEDGRTLEVVMDAIHNDQGGFAGGAHFLRDITEPKQMRQRMMTSEKMVAVGQLVAGVAHEINNPLTGITGYAQLMMMREDLDEKTRKDVQSIASEAARATRIVRQLLSFARKHQPERQPVNVNDVIRDCIGLKGYDLKVNNIEVSTVLAEGLPEIAADRYQLQQVFINLITNAEQAILGNGKGGTLEVATSVDDGKVQVFFTDDGPGVPEDVRSRLFDPFFTTKDVGKGTGLGLSVCYGIVQEHQGTIWAEAAPAGAGARFVVELPVQAMIFGKEEGDVEEEATVAPGRILLIDDEESVREVLAETLRRNGHTVEIAANGRDAMALLEESEYDCIISDVKMPVMTGAELHQAVMSSNPEAAGRFIFISGDTVNAETRKYLESVPNPSLNKPFSLQELLRQLQAMLADGRKAA